VIGELAERSFGFASNEDRRVQEAGGWLFHSSSSV
jgi:hypothetical protein